MNACTHIAQHLRDVHFGGNWTWSSMQKHLQDVTWQQATTQVHGFNTIATLVYHTHYFVAALLKVLQGGPLDSKDAYSFAHPPLHSPADWEQFLGRVWADADALATHIAQLPEARLWETFVEEKYGTYYRNLHGVIEHTHYHLGQMVLVKKLVLQQAALD